MLPLKLRPLAAPRALYIPAHATRISCAYRSTATNPGFRPAGCRTRGRSGRFKWILGGFIAGVVVAKNYSVHEIADGCFTHRLPENQQQTELYTRQLEKDLYQLPVVQELMSDPAYTSLRSWNLFQRYESLPISASKETLHETLTTPGSISIPPLTFHNASTRESVTIVHLGKRLSGYPFLVHGGMLNLVLDEVFKNNCALDLGLKDVDTLSTEQLSLDYRFPTRVDQFVVVKTKSAPPEDGHIKMKGAILSANGRIVLVKANGVLRVNPPSSFFSQPLLKSTPAPSSASAAAKRGWLWAST